MLDTRCSLNVILSEVKDLAVDMEQVPFTPSGQLVAISRGSTQAMGLAPISAERKRASIVRWLAVWYNLIDLASARAHLTFTAFTRAGTRFPDWSSLFVSIRYFNITNVTSALRTA